MYLRADVLEDNLARLDQISHSPRRWPSGNLWYLYGSKFIDYILKTYGDSTYAAVATDYGARIVPWSINRSIRRVTGRTYPQLYRGWERSLKRKYGAQIAIVKKRGLREGTRLTHGGRVATTPRWIPKRCRKKGERPGVYYIRDDGVDRAGIYRVDLDARGKFLSKKIVARSSGKFFNIAPDCSLVLETVATSRRLYNFSDIFRLPNGKRATTGTERALKRLTVGRRARYPDISPDGRTIVYVTNSRGTQTLKIADLSPTWQVKRERTLVKSRQFEQAFTPRFSPNGKRVAYGVWRTGGYRDIRVVDVETGIHFSVTSDRALDQQPTWSADGRYLYFTSDRTGIANVYAYDLAKKRLWMVTNVRTGAYMPEVTPDGKQLYYIGYTSEGFDLYSMELDRKRWIRAPKSIIVRPDPPSTPSHARWPVKKFTPWSTIRPRAYQWEYGSTSFGQAFTISTSGSDAVGLHSFAASVTKPLDSPEVSLSAAYAYRQLPFDFRISAFHRPVLRGGYVYGEQDTLITERLNGVTSGISYGLPGTFDFQSFNLNYTVAEYASDLPVGDSATPFSPVTREPSQGFLGLLRLGYTYSNTDSFVYGFGPGKGFAVTVAGDYAAHALGSETTHTALSARLTGYLTMPWLSNHVLAMAASGAAAGGTYPRRGIYSTGGFLDTPILDAFNAGITQTAFLLRGYAPGKFIGNHFNLVNAEYRFPIWYADRGISTLPAFLRGMHGTVFADYGGAFRDIDLDDPFEEYHLGLGAEVYFDLFIGYFARAVVRVGYARGMDDEAIEGGQTYMVLSSPF